MLLEENIVCVCVCVCSPSSERLNIKCNDTSDYYYIETEESAARESNYGLMSGEVADDAMSASPGRSLNPSPRAARLGSDMN